MNKKLIHCALLGAGKVGQEFYYQLEKMKKYIPKRIGAELDIRYILVKDKEISASGINKDLLTTSWQDIINDSEVDIIIDLIGSEPEAKEYIFDALTAGKNVVTANKKLLAECGNEIFEMAKSNNKDIAFEAAVASAIPTIRPIMQNMAGDVIDEIIGIFSSSSNYILTKMSEENMTYEDALSKAIEKGLTEEDYSEDITGIDTARKVAILASLIYHTEVKIEDVYREGISEITYDDIRYAKELGYVIKLAGLIRMTNGKVEARVHPMFFAKDHPLASVNNNFKAIYFYGEAMNELMFMGKGSGAKSTASAVLSDVMDVCRNIVNNCCGRMPVEIYNNFEVMPICETKSRYFLRTKVEDTPGTLAAIADVIKEYEVGVAKVVQMDTVDGVADLLFIVETVEEGHIVDACQAMLKVDQVFNISSVVRVC